MSSDAVAFGPDRALTAAEARARLVEEIADGGVRDARVLAAMGRAPRELFVPATFRELSYENTALPIGQGQTISQPQVVAQMTEALGLTDRMKVLEVGTGSGYQTAILCMLARRVYTIERRRPLAVEAERLLKSLSLNNFVTRIGDGAAGWPEQAPFDRIIVTAAADVEVPPALLDQLAEGGVMVVPVAASPIDQRLLTIRKTATDYEVEDWGATRFVPLVTEEGPHPGSLSVNQALARLRGRS